MCVLRDEVNSVPSVVVSVAVVRYVIDLEWLFAWHVSERMGDFHPRCLLGLGFEGFDLGRQCFQTLKDGVVEVDDGRRIVDAEVGELDAQTLDGRVVEVRLFSLGLFEGGLDGLDAFVDTVDVYFAHVFVVCLVCFCPVFIGARLRLDSIL